MLYLRHTIVICTRGRPESLSALMSSIMNCAESKSVKIFIVLNGHSTNELRNISDTFNNLSNQVEILESAPGLATARNMALSRIASDLVTFLDDDVTLPKNYLQEIDHIFSSNISLEGLSPRIKGLYNPSRNNQLSILKRRPKYGRLTRSCENYWVPDIYSETATPVQWLPGCSMTFRVSSIKNRRFSEELMKGPTGGYSLGEDVDFSIRFSSLVALNTIAIEHLQAISVRDNDFVMSGARGRWKAFLIRNHSDKVSATRTILVLVSAVVYFGILSILRRGIFAKKLKNKYIQLRYLLKELANPTLVNNENA